MFTFVNFVNAQLSAITIFGNTMTKNETNKLLAIFMLATVVTISGANYGFASHGEEKWASSDVDYKCMSNLYNLDMETGSSECWDLLSSVDIWNGIASSSLDFDQVTSGQDIEVTSLNLYGAALAYSSPTISGTTITESIIVFDNSEEWGDKDGDDWWKWWVIDYISVGAHEFGHNVRLVHDSSSDLMEDFTDANVHRTPSSHDISEVQGMYP